MRYLLRIWRGVNRRKSVIGEKRLFNYDDQGVETLFNFLINFKNI
jgi:hypothetical protein